MNGQPPVWDFHCDCVQFGWYFLSHNRRLVAGIGSNKGGRPSEGQGEKEPRGSE